MRHAWLIVALAGCEAPYFEVTCAGERGLCTPDSGPRLELPNMEDDNHDGLIDDGFRRTFYSFQTGNGTDYGEPGTDGDHCFGWEDAPKGQGRCMGIQGPTGYSTDHTAFAMYVPEIATHPSVQRRGDHDVVLGREGVVLTELVECYDHVATAHQYWPWGSARHQVLAATSSVTCTTVGFVRASTAAPQRPGEILMYELYSKDATDVLYDDDPAANVITFAERGPAWGAWRACGADAMCTPGTSRVCGDGQVDDCIETCQWLGCRTPCPTARCAVGARRCTAAGGVEECQADACTWSFVDGCSAPSGRCCADLQFLPRVQCVAEAGPEPPRIVVPVEDDMLQGPRVILRWMKQGSVSQYRVRICHDADLQSCVVDRVLDEGVVRYDRSDEVAAGRWYWAVAGRPACGIGAWGPFSPSRLFTLK